jgi:hypothetical protein
MARKSHYDRMGEKITPGIIVAAIVIIILKLFL